MLILKTVKIWCYSFKISYKFCQQVVLYCKITVQSYRNTLQVVLCKQQLQSSVSLPTVWNLSKSLQFVFLLEHFVTLNCNWKISLVAVEIVFNERYMSAIKTHCFIEQTTSLIFYSKHINHPVFHTTGVAFLWIS